MELSGKETRIRESLKSITLVFNNLNILQQGAKGDEKLVLIELYSKANAIRLALIQLNTDKEKFIQSHLAPKKEAITSSKEVRKTMSPIDFEVAEKLPKIIIKPNKELIKNSKTSMRIDEKTVNDEVSKKLLDIGKNLEDTEDINPGELGE
jgi:hypothetical protein